MRPRTQRTAMPHKVGNGTLPERTLGSDRTNQTTVRDWPVGATEILLIPAISKLLRFNKLPVVEDVTLLTLSKIEVNNNQFAASIPAMHREDAQTQHRRADWSSRSDKAVASSNRQQLS